MSRKVRENQEEGLFIIKKKKGLGNIEGISGRPRLLFQGTNKEGNEVTKDMGEYTGVKFPSSVEDIVPKFDSNINSWTFEGDEETLQYLVNAIKLKFPPKHHLSGQIIKEANRGDWQDPFFDNPEWTERPFIMEGSSAVLDASNPRLKFLMLCSAGNRFVESAYTKDNPMTAAGIQYSIVKSSSGDSEEIDLANTEIELIGTLATMEDEIAKQISIVLGLIFTDSNDNISRIKPNLLEAVKKVGNNPGERRLFEGKSYQTFFMELAKAKPDSLTKQVNIKLAMNKNILRYKEGVYSLQGKALTGVDRFSRLLEHFSAKENTEDYTTLLEALEA